MKNSFFCKITSLVLTACLLLPSEIVNATDSVDVPSEEDAHGELNGKVLYNDSGAGQRTYTVSIPTKVYLNKDTCECKYPVSCKGEVGTGKEVHVWVQDDSEQDGTNIIFKQNNDVTQTFVADVNPYELDFAYNEINPDTFVEKTDVNINAVGIDTSVDWSSDITFLFQLQNQDKGHEHVDYNSDGVCDEDGCNEHVHYDINNDGVCDKEDCKFIMGSHTHSFSIEGTVLTAPTCSTEGVKEMLCICGAKEEQSIPVTEHNYVNGTCSKCGDEYIDPNVEMLKLAPEGELDKWQYELVDNSIVLGQYVGVDSDAMIYDSYQVDGTVYKTRLKSNNTLSGTVDYNTYLFTKNENIESVKVGANIDLSQTEGLVAMFGNCTKLKTVKFYGKTLGAVIDLSSMFNNCYELTECNINSLDLSNVIRTSNMFSCCNSLPGMTFKDNAFTSLTNANCMFYGCIAFPSDFVFDYSMPKLVECNGLFKKCTSFVSVTVNIRDNENCMDNIGNLFNGCTNLKEISLSGNFSKVRYVDSLFKDCSSLLDVDVSALKESRIRSYRHMFNGCKSLTHIDLSMLDLSNAEWGGYNNMFNGCSNLETILVNNTWKTSTLSESPDTFTGCKISSVTYVQ